MNHYFFFGTYSEDVLCEAIMDAESIECEPVQVFSGHVQAPAKVLHGNGQPQFIPVFKLLVRCPKTSIPEVENGLKEIAARHDAKAKIVPFNQKR